MNKILLVSLVLVTFTFGVGDITTTIITLNKFGIEAEGAYIAKQVVNCYGICGLIIFKSLVTAALCILNFLLYKRGSPITAIATSIIASILGIIIIINNSLAIIYGYTIITITVPIIISALSIIIYILENCFWRKNMQSNDL